ncbi:MAG: adenylate/guanylate cyclase domain-containing protein [Anaerolineales bacterium]
MADQPPRVRFSLLWKITLPFMLLAMVLGLGAALLINDLLSQEETDRFLRQLIDAGQQATDSVVRSEIDLLELERLIANTEGVAEAVSAGNAEDLRARVLPLVVNAGADVVAVVDSEGTSIVTVRRRPGAPPGDYDTLRGESYYGEWPFVQRVLSGVTDEVVGDKHAGLEPLEFEGIQHYVFFVAGPLLQANSTLNGSVLVGKYVDRLGAEVANEAGANVSSYDVSGTALSSTLEPASSESINVSSATLQSIQESEQGQSPVRAITVAGSEYWEVLTPLVVRQGTEDLGVMGVSLLRVPVEGTTEDSLPIVLRFGVLALALIVLIGLLLSNSITKRLGDLVRASSEIASGDLDAHVDESGRDEIGALSITFNRMVEGLREGSIYRDLLGRSVTPEVRDQLRTSFSDGALMLKGQSSDATILFADFRGYTSMAERAEPADIMKTLNDYFAGVVPIISLHGGVVNKFDGDAVMAFFGILPKYLPSRVSALQATHAGLEMLEHIRNVNKERDEGGKQAFEMGIGISTGSVIAGGLGSEDRVHYTVVGDTVNTAQRIQEITRNLGGTALVISDPTYRKLGAVRHQFRFGRKGLAQLKGKQQEVLVHEVVGRSSTLVGREVVDDRIQHYTASLPRVAEILGGETTKDVQKPLPASEDELEFLEGRLEGEEPGTGPLPAFPDEG